MQNKRLRFSPWVGKIPWRREWLPALVFWPGEFHEQRSLAGYSPWGHIESDTTEWLTLSLSKLVSKYNHLHLCFVNDINEHYQHIKIKIALWTSLQLTMLNTVGITSILIIPSSTFFHSTDTSAAAAKSLQSCQTLCDPTDRSPPGSPVPEMLLKFWKQVFICFNQHPIWMSNRIPSFFLSPHTLPIQKEKS